MKRWYRLLEPALLKQRKHSALAAYFARLCW